MSVDAYLGRQLDRLRAEGLFRDPRDSHARWEVPASAARRREAAFVDATSNDYLGLAGELVSVSRETSAPQVGGGSDGPGSDERSQERHRAGSGASRLVQGTWPEHERLEAELARWVGAESALLFSSGFAANLGAISALAGPDSAVISDQFNHASMVDGCRLSRAQVAIVPHLDLGALETALARSAQFPVRWVVTESYFSMDGDGPNLQAVRALCDRYAAFLLVDEAHALGVFGPRGAGRCAEAEIQPDVLIGTLGKAVGTEGAFVAGSEAVRAWLWNRARSFVFSTAPSPASCALTLDHVKEAVDAEGARERLHANTRRLRDQLEAAGLSLVRNSFGPIVSVVVGSNEAAMELSAALRRAGMLVQPIRPPTVPVGFARVRITVSASFEVADVDRLADAVVSSWRTLYGASR